MNFTHRHGVQAVQLIEGQSPEWGPGESVEHYTAPGALVGVSGASMAHQMMIREGAVVSSGSVSRGTQTCTRRTGADGSPGTRRGTSPSGAMSGSAPPFDPIPLPFDDLPLKVYELAGTYVIAASPAAVLDLLGQHYGEPWETVSGDTREEGIDACTVVDGATPITVQYDDFDITHTGVEWIAIFGAGRFLCSEEE